MVLAGLLQETFWNWRENKTPRLGAALAYYAVFSIGPLLMIAVGVAGLFFGHEAAQTRIVEQAQNLVGHDGAQILQTMIGKSSSPASGVLAMLAGLVTLLMGASGVLVELQDALDTVWGVTPRTTGLLGFLRERLLSFGMILGIGFLLLISLAVSAWLSAVGKWLGEGRSVPLGALHAVNFLASFVLTTLLFAMIYKVLPRVRVAWSDVFLGAAATSLLFTIGKLAIGFYLGKSSIASAYGAAGSIVVILVWVYYSSQILLFGAEFTQVWSKRFGSRFGEDMIRTRPFEEHRAA